MGTQDFLGECNTQKVPLEDFQRQFCVRCLNPECGRSQTGRSLFEKRVATWEDRLFNQIPKMDLQDPRYEKIRAQKFRSLDQSAPLEVRSWVDPRDLDENEKTQVSTDPVPPPQELKEVSLTPPSEVVILKPVGLVNTPSAPRKMIGPPVAPTTTKVVPDPWAPKQKTSGEKIVTPGARVRFGSGVSK